MVPVSITVRFSLHVIILTAETRQEYERTLNGQDGGFSGGCSGYAGANGGGFSGGCSGYAGANGGRFSGYAGTNGGRFSGYASTNGRRFSGYTSTNGGRFSGYTSANGGGFSGGCSGYAGANGSGFSGRCSGYAGPNGGQSGRDAAGEDPFAQHGHYPKEEDLPTMMQNLIHRMSTDQVDPRERAVMNLLFDLIVHNMRGGTATDMI